MTDLYTSQRAMRNMRRAAMQRGVIAILDVGTSKIACLILRFDGPDRLREQELAVVGSRRTGAVPRVHPGDIGTPIRNTPAQGFGARAGLVVQLVAVAGAIACQ